MENQREKENAFIMPHRPKMPTAESCCQQDPPTEHKRSKNCILYSGQLHQAQAAPGGSGTPVDNIPAEPLPYTRQQPRLKG